MMPACAIDHWTSPEQSNLSGPSPLHTHRIRTPAVPPIGSSAEADPSICSDCPCASSSCLASLPDTTMPPAAILRHNSAELAVGAARSAGGNGRIDTNHVGEYAVHLYASGIG